MRAMWTNAGAIALLAFVGACQSDTAFVYPDDMASENYLKRTYAAREFANRQDAASAPMAFSLLTDEHLTIRRLAADTLRTMSDGEDFGWDIDLPEPDQQRIAARWKAWWVRVHGEGAHG